MALSTTGPSSVRSLAAGNADSSGYLRIGELARRSGLPVSTIRHYIGEGLLGPARRTSRNMAYYPPDALERISLIKTLQDELYLPLKVVRKLFDAYEALEPDAANLDLLLEVRERLLERHPDLLPDVPDIPASATGRLELSASEIEAVEQSGIVSAHEADGQRSYDEVDYRILKALSGVRAAGLPPDLAGADDLALYATALRKLARIEALLFARRIGRHSPGGDVAELVCRVIPAVNEVICALHHKFLLEELRAPPGNRDRKKEASRPARPTRRPR